MSNYNDWLEKELNMVVEGLNPLEGGLSYTAQTTLNVKYSVFQKCLEMYEKYHQKPVVPQYVADWFEENKNTLELSLHSLARDLYKNSVFARNEFEHWADKVANKPLETLIKMKLFGYEVEQEKKYAVQVPHNSYRYYWKNESEIWSMVEMDVKDLKNKHNFQFTAEEIKELLPDIPEKYWVEVEK